MAGDIAQWENIGLACAKPRFWFPEPSPLPKKQFITNNIFSKLICFYSRFIVQIILVAGPSTDNQNLQMLKDPIQDDIALQMTYAYPPEYFTLPLGYL
jgi:hypothetical protein